MLVCVLGISAGQILFRLASSSILIDLDVSAWLQFPGEIQYAISCGDNQRWCEMSCWPLPTIKPC